MGPDIRTVLILLQYGFLHVTISVIFSHIASIFTCSVEFFSHLATFSHIAAFSHLRVPQSSSRASLTRTSSSHTTGSVSHHHGDESVVASQTPSSHSPSLDTQSSRAHQHGDESVSASQDAHPSVMITINAESEQRSTTYRNPDDDSNTDELRGFIPVNRPRYAPFFVSGIRMKNDNQDNVDDTVNDIYNYMKRKKCTVKSVRKIKQSGIVL